MSKMNTNIDESDIYKLIKVSRGASEAEIHKAFRRRALELHPDKHQPGASDELMKRLTAAKDTLLDPDKRQQYDDKHWGTDDQQEISGILHSGKRLSSRYKRKLSKYMTNFENLDIKDNFNEIFDIMSILNDKCALLINTCITADFALADTDQNQVKQHRDVLQSYFYAGQYESMAKYLVEQPCNSTSISNLYDFLTTGRDVSCTAPSFQAGLSLLKAQLHAIEHKHESSLVALQQAVFTCPTEEVFSAINVLLTSRHFIAGTQVIIRQLLKGDVELAQEHKLQDRLVRTNNLRLVARNENSIHQDNSSGNWEKALMYLDLSMAASGIGLIHCIIVSMTYMLEEIARSDNVPRVYAICSIICELAIDVIILARRGALPVTEMHFNKLSFIVTRKAHERLKVKLSTYKIGFFRRLFGPRRLTTKLVTEVHTEVYKMIANSIHRLVIVSPLVDLKLSTVADMLYLDVSSNQFVEQFYTSQIVKNISRQTEMSWSHLYPYYLLECAWKSGNDTKFASYREESMKSLLDKNGWSPESVEQNMWWSVLNRDSGGWLDVTKPWLNLPGVNYDSVDGVQIDLEKGTFRVLCTPSPPGQEGLFNSEDIVEVFHHGIAYSIFSLDPPDSDLQYHPFHELKYSPGSLGNTNLLQTLLHADYLLKMISMGTEVSAAAPHAFKCAYSCSEDENAFLNLLPEYLREKVKPLSARRGGNIKENVHRFWIESGVVEFKVQELNKGETTLLHYELGHCKMEVKTQLMKHNSDGELVDDSEEEEADEDESDNEQFDRNKSENTREPNKRKQRITVEKQFANDFTENYDEVGYYFPILLRLRQLVKLDTIFVILRNVYEHFETAKKKLNEKLTEKFRKDFKDRRDDILYPQYKSYNVNKLYKRGLANHGLIEADLTDGDKSRVKRAIGLELMELDAKLVKELSKTVASEYDISNCRELSTRIENWLDDGLFTSYTKELVAFMVDQVHPREHARLNRFRKNATLNGIRFDREVDLSVKTDHEQCPWVPAAYSREERRRVYGGVFLVPHIEKVTNFSTKSGNNSFVRNWGGSIRGKGNSTTADAPAGSSRNQMNQPKNPPYQPVRHEEEAINGLVYSGHALDRMQDRGLFPSVIENTIKIGIATPGKGATTKLYDEVNNITSVVDGQGKVVTVYYGGN